ncbi:uncharacterized protein [Palaemon carinicauda]|uniref:uncharacterized protein n=1 Tax=Palaemon carinicauda TaxID=392227 RepID=UPI0035B62CB3
MFPKYYELPLLLLMVELPTIVRMEKLDPWEFRDCPFKASANAMPISTYTPRLLNLKKLGNLQAKTWIMFSGTVSYKNQVGLTAGYLYSVTKQNPKDSSDKSYTFTRDGTSHVYPAELLELDQLSYGFVSCGADEAKAIEEADKWWRTCPYSTITIVLIALGALFVLVVIVSITICVIRRRRARRNANLFPLSKRMRPKRGDNLYV